LVCVDPLPVASFTFSPSLACSGSPINFNFNGTGVGLTYQWDFGDGGDTTLQNPTHIYDTFGCGISTYNVSLRITDRNGCTDDTTIQVQVKQQPQANYYEEHNWLFCHTDTSNIRDTARIYLTSSDPCITQFQVNWGDGSPVENYTSSQFPIEHTFTHIGYYPVTITAIGANGCQTVFQQQIVIESNPVASIIGPPTGTNTGCAPMTVCITNISQGISSTTLLTVNWGDGITEPVSPSTVGDTICHVYHTSGCNNGTMTSYTITFTAQNMCDYSQTSFSPIRVFQPPQAHFNVNPDTGCVGSPITFINNSLPNSCASPSTTYYTWDFGDGTVIGPTGVPWMINPQQIITHTYNDTGTYVVTLTACNYASGVAPGCGCTSYQTTVFIAQTFAEFTYDTVCFGDTTHFFDHSWANGGHIISWQWNFGDGDSSTQQNHSHLYNNWGDFNASLIVLSNLGCRDTVWHIVHVDTLPYVNFTYDTVCLGDTTHFFNLSYGRGANIVYYKWWFGDGDTLTNVVNPTHYYDSAGTYTVTLIAFDDKGCKDTVRHTIIVSPFPVANFSSDTVCLSNPTHFTDQSTAAFGSIISWNWNFGDASGNSSLQNPSYIYADTGSYNVQLIVQTNIGCRDTIIKPAYVAPYPQVSISADTVCRGNETHFTSTTNGYGWPIISYIWDFGDGDTSHLANPTHVYANPGQYNVSLIVFNSFGCTDTAYIQVQVNSTHSPNFAFVTNCARDTVYFTDLSTAHGTPIVLWLWNFGDGNVSTDQNPQHIYASGGNYTVTLIVQAAGGCSDSIKQTVHVYALPTADFTFTSACYGSASHFTDASLANEGTITSWNWNFGDGSGSSSLQNPSYIYPDTGHYTVDLIIQTNFGCKDTVQHIVPYLPRPTALFIADTVCAQINTHFTDQSLSNGSTISSYSWDYGDGFQSTLQNPDHVYAMGGTYMVRFIVESTSGCADTIFKPVHVDSIPTAEFSVNPVCFNNYSQFIDASSANSGSIVAYQWDFGDGSGTSSVQNPMYLYSSPGNYTVNLIITNSKGCRDTVQHIATIYTLPTAQFSHTSSCLMHNIQFTDLTIPGSGALSSWNWDFGDGTGSSTQQNPTYFYSTLDTFPVTLIVQDIYGCKDTITNSIVVAPLPIADFQADSVCRGLYTSFTDLTNDLGYAITQWQWNFGDSHTSNVQNPTHLYANSGTYNVQLIVENTSQCRDTVVKPVFVKPLPQADFIYNNTCSRDTAKFFDTSIPNASSLTAWQWDFGDGNSSNNQNPQHIYMSDGTYNVQLITTNSFGCNDTISHNITIYRLPTANFTASMACIGFPTSFTDLSTPGSGTINNWSWNFGEPGGSSTAQNPTYTYTSGLTSYNVTLMIADNLGCRDTVTLPISLHPQPTANFTATYACSGHPNQFTDLSVAVPGGSITAWQWDFGDGSGTSTLQNPQYTYPITTSPHTYNVTLIAYDNNGCPDTITKNVIVYPNPSADFISTIVCVNQQTSFTDQSTAASAPIVNWQWNFGDGAGTSTQQNPQYTYPFSWNIEHYNTQLIITDTLGCKDTITHDVRVNPLPRVNFTATTACAGNATQFTDLTHSNGGAIVQWQWNFGDGIGSSTQQNPSYVYDTVHIPTTFNVTLTTQDVNGCMHDTTLPVLVNPNPVAAFNPISACSGYPNQFIDLSHSTGGNIVQWLWNFGDGVGTSTQQNPQYQYPNTSNVTTYNVTLHVVDQNGCKDSVVGTATIYPSPVADFAPDSACSGQSIHFIDQTSTLGGTVTGWNWNFGDGIGTSTQQNPVYTYDSVSNNTTYPVTLIAENSNGCRDTITKYVQIWPLPVVNFNNTVACFGNPTNFFDASYSNGAPLQSWNWNFGDGIGTSSQQNPTYIYGHHGTYQATLTVTDQHGCTNQYTKPIMVDSLPIPGFTYQLSCSQGIVHFTNTSQGNGSTIVGYQWNFGDLTWSSQINPSHYYQDTGIYLVTLQVVNNRGCSDSIKQYVHIVPGIEWDFVASQECYGYATIFNDFAINPNIPAVAWLWNFGDGSTSTQSDPTHLYPYAGSFNVLLTVFDAQGCSYSVQHNVTVYPQPMANFTNTIATQFNPVNFTDQSTTPSGTIVGWQWDFGDGATSTQQNPSHVYNNPGTYQVTLIVRNSYGCQDTITKTLNILPLVTAEFTFDTVCAQTPMHFTDQSSTGLGTIQYWYWDFGDGHSSNLQNPEHTYFMAGTYTVTLIATNSSGVSDTVKHQVLVLEAPYADFTSSQVCFGNPTAFLNQSTGYTSPIVSWQWNLADGNMVYGPSFSHIYSQPGTYNVQLIVTNALGCTDTVVHPVNVWENPHINIIATPKEGCKPLDVTFIDSSYVSDGSIVSWLWSFGDGTSSVSPAGAYHRYDHSGVYDVTLTVISNHGCVATQTFVNYIFVYPHPIASFYYMPSNPTMYDPHISCYDISIGASSWYWNFGDESYSTEQNPMHMYEQPGNYTITLIAKNLYGCADTTRQKVHVDADEIIFTPNAFSPNGDGVNDYFMPYGYGFPPTDFVLRIYNRWGQIVFVSYDINKPWDGRDMNSGEIVEQGVYVWKMWFRNLEGKLKHQVGKVVLLP